MANRTKARRTTLARTRALAAGLFALLAASMGPAAPAWAEPSSQANTRVYGPFGPEGPRLREQLWILPSADHGFPLRATVFRPVEASDAKGEQPPRPLVVINHGTSDATRLAVAMPIYYWLSRWFVERGYVVALPQRRGHGATAGPMAESVGTCGNADHYRSGLAAAEDIEGTVNYMSEQPFVAAGQTIVVGISSGGWASLALASRNTPNVRAVVNIAGGRGGRPFGRHVDTVCGEDRLVAAARAYGRTARVPTLWLYAANDSYFRPDLARALASVWQDAGGKADLHVFPAYGSDGHQLADDRAGWDVWGHAVDDFLASTRDAPMAALEQPSVDASKGDRTPATIAPLETAASDGATRAP